MNKLVIIYFLICLKLYAQSTTEPIYNDEIYKFLDRQAQKGIITFFDDIKSSTRIRIAVKLKQINKINSKRPVLHTHVKSNAAFA